MLFIINNVITYTSHAAQLALFARYCARFTGIQQICVRISVIYIPFSLQFAIFARVTFSRLRSALRDALSADRIDRTHIYIETMVLFCTPLSGREGRREVSRLGFARQAHSPSSSLTPAVLIKHRGRIHRTPLESRCRSRAGKETKVKRPSALQTRRAAPFPPRVCVAS